MGVGRRGHRRHKAIKVMGGKPGKDEGEIGDIDCAYSLKTQKKFAAGFENMPGKPDNHHRKHQEDGDEHGYGKYFAIGKRVAKGVIQHAENESGENQ